MFVFIAPPPLDQRRAAVSYQRDIVFYHHAYARQPLSVGRTQSENHPASQRSIQEEVPPGSSPPEQYWLNMRDLFSGRLKSIKDDRPVLHRIAERLPGHGLPQCPRDLSLPNLRPAPGVYAAKHAGKLPDVLTSILAFVFIALPGFWISDLIVIGLVKFTDAPILGTQTYGVDFPNAVPSGWTVSGTWPFPRWCFPLEASPPNRVTFARA